MKMMGRFGDDGLCGEWGGVGEEKYTRAVGSILFVLKFQVDFCGGKSFH